MNTFFKIIVILMGILLLPSCQAQEGKVKEKAGKEVEGNYKWRKKMVEEQIKARGIQSPKVIRAMLKVEREKFVPEEYKKMAYEDHPLPIGEGQTISQPYIVAFMTEILDLDKEDRVLEIGTGSGYQAAILAELSKEVYTIEIIPSLGESARKLLDSLGYKNIFVKIGDGYQGWPEKAPFDAIIVTCSPTHIPKPLQEQVAEGGKIIIPVGESQDQQLYYLTKRKGEIKQKAIFPVRFVPMTKKGGEKY